MLMPAICVQMWVCEERLDKIDMVDTGWPSQNFMMFKILCKLCAVLSHRYERVNLVQFIIIVMGK